MVVSNNCYTSGEYLTMIYWGMDIFVTEGQKFDDFLFSDFDNKKYDVGVGEYWDYPISEIDEIVENNINVVLVKFADNEYRFCEI